MPIYEFEIQSCIRVEMEGKDSEDARIKLIDNIRQFANQMVEGNCYVSNGKKKGD